LPKYNPDVAGEDATQWCAAVDIILRGKQLNDTALKLALSKALEGTAAQWLSQVCMNEQRYETSETPAAVILNLLNSRPSNGESLPVFASQPLNLLVLIRLKLKWSKVKKKC